MHRFPTATSGPMAAVLGGAMLATACTEPTWYPGLPTAVEDGLGSDGGTGSDTGTTGTDSGGTDSGSTDSGGSDAGGDSGEPGLPCSSPGTEAATLTIDVQVDEGLLLWWRAQDCTEYNYGIVPPYVPKEQGTYVGHVWVLRDAVTDEYYDHLTMTEPDQLWEVTE